MSNSNGLSADWPEASDASSDDEDSDIPSEPPPPPPRPEVASTKTGSSRVRPRSANPAKGRTPHGGSEYEAGAGAVNPAIDGAGAIPPADMREAPRVSAEASATGVREV